MKKGFTLIELIVTISIIAIIALILTPTVTGYIDNTRLTTCNENFRILSQKYTIERAIGESSLSDDQLLDIILTQYNYTKISTGIYQSPASDKINISVTFDTTQTLVTSCYLKVAVVDAVKPSYKKTEAAITGFTTAYEKILSDNLANNTKGISGTALINNYGTLTSVDEELAKKAYGDTYSTALVWKANTFTTLKTGVNATNYIMFATKTNGTGWTGYLAYYNGKYYKSSRVDSKGVSTAANIDFFKQPHATVADIESDFNDTSNGWELVK